MSIPDGVDPQSVDGLTAIPENSNFCVKAPSKRAPMVIPPDSECYKCSLLCELKFRYPKTSNWNMNAASILYKSIPDGSSVPIETQIRTANQSVYRLLRFYVSNTDGLSREDVEYNGRKYQLEFIEFYTPALHQLPVVNATKSVPNKPAKYDAEMVMCHRSLDSVTDEDANSTTHWLNISVQIHSMYTYSLSQDFFAQMISPVCSDHHNENRGEYANGLGPYTSVAVNGTDQKSQYGTIIPVSFIKSTGYDKDVLKYPYYHPTQIQVRLKQGDNSIIIQVVSIKTLVAQNDAILRSKNVRDSLLQPKYPFDVQLKTIIQKLKGSKPLTYNPNPTSKTQSTYQCELEYFVMDRVKDQQANRTGYYYVELSKGTYQEYAQRDVRVFSSGGKCPWSPEANPNNRFGMSGGIDATHPVATGSKAQTCTVVGAMAKGTNLGNFCMPITVDQNWSPYQGLPYDKALYIYGGMFPYAPGLYNENDQVTWVVMKNPVPMHTAEYEKLLSLIKPPNVSTNSQIASATDSFGFLFNVGSLYSLAPPQGRPVYFNDGTTIETDADQEKFYVKCARRSELETKNVLGKSDVTVDGRTADEDLARISQIHSPLTYQASTSTFFKPPQGSVSTLVLCFILSIMLFSMFAMYQFGGNKEGFGIRSGGNVVFTVVCLAMFVSYGMTFISGSKIGASVITSGMLWTFLILSLNVFYAVIHRKAQQESILSWIVDIFYWIFLVAFNVLLVLSVFVTPLHIYNPTIRDDRTFWYSNYDLTNVPDDDLDNVTVFIGTRPAVDIDFAGYQLQYRNDYTLSQSYTDSNTYNPAKKLVQRAPNYTKPVPMDDPNMLFYSIDNSFWRRQADGILYSVPPAVEEDLMNAAMENADTDQTTENELTNQTHNLRVKKNLGLLALILTEYDSRMKSNNIDPYIAFVESTTKIVTNNKSPDMMAKSRDDVLKNLADSFPQLHAYLNRQPIDFNVSDTQVLTDDNREIITTTITHTKVKS